MTATLPSALLSQLAYAKHRGVTHGAVAKAIKSGRLKRALVTGDDGKLRIDPAVADTEWASNTSPAMQRKDATQGNVPAGVQSTGTAPSDSAPESKPAPAPRPMTFDALGILETPARDSDPGDGVSMADARAMKERYLALLAQLDYQVKAGILVEARDARQAAFNVARKARDMLMSIADRVAPVVAGLDNQFECHRVITTEVKRVMDELSKNPMDGVVEEPAHAGS